MSASGRNRLTAAWVSRVNVWRGSHRSEKFYLSGASVRKAELTFGFLAACRLCIVAAPQPVEGRLFSFYFDSLGASVGP
jgi:hypothetical protein